MKSPLGSLHDERMELLAELKRERDPQLRSAAWWAQKKPVRSAVEERKAAKLAMLRRGQILGGVGMKRDAIIESVSRGNMERIARLVGEHSAAAQCLKKSIEYGKPTFWRTRLGYFVVVDESRTP